MKLHKIKDNIIDLIHRELESELQQRNESDNEDIILSLINQYKYMVSLTKGIIRLSHLTTLDALLKEYK